MNNLLVAYELGVTDRQNNKFVRNLKPFTTSAMREYARGWIDEWQNETTKTKNLSSVSREYYT